MPAKKPAPKREPKQQDDPDESRRFVGMARELECDETGKKFKKGLNLLSPTHRAAMLKRGDK